MPIREMGVWYENKGKIACLYGLITKNISHSSNVSFLEVSFHVLFDSPATIIVLAFSRYSNMYFFK